MDLIEHRIYEAKLGLCPKNGKFKSCPATLSPWMLEQAQFNKAIKSAIALSLLFENIRQDRRFLLNCLDDFEDTSSLLFYLKKILSRQQNPSAQHLNLSRQDLLLDKEGDWRLVESNSIAAGMGPFCEKLAAIQQQETSNASIDYAPNPAIKTQAKAMYDAAIGLSGAQQALIVFVVQSDEDNIFDQQFLSDELIKLGAKVVYKTFSQLQKELKSDKGRLKLESTGSVDLFYFRTGYNLKDYRDKRSETEQYLQLREWIEEHEVIVSPSISAQITASKWLQMKLASLSSDVLSGRFFLSQEQAELASQSLHCNYTRIEDEAHTRALIDTGRWILKSQGEGGGSVFDASTGLPELQDLCANKTRYLLMEKIDTVVRRENLNVYSRGSLSSYAEVISELGIFTLGDDHHYGGYLLRSKPANKLETGVHSGEGFLDCIGLI